MFPWLQQTFVVEEIATPLQFLFSSKFSRDHGQQARKSSLVRDYPKPSENSRTSSEIFQRGNKNTGKFPKSQNLSKVSEDHDHPDLKKIVEHTRRYLRLNKIAEAACEEYRKPKETFQRLVKQRSGALACLPPMWACSIPTCSWFSPCSEVFSSGIAVILPLEN